MEEKVQDIIKKIEEDSRAEVGEILKNAESRVNEIITKAEEEVRPVKEDILKKGEREAEQERLRVLANAKLQSRKMKLDAREEVIGEVFSRVKEELNNIQSSNEYKDILKSLIKEAASSIGEKEIVISARKEDSKILTKEFLGALSKELKCELSLSPEPIFTKGGIIARSKMGKADLIEIAELEKKISKLQTEAAAKAIKITNEKQGAMVKYGAYDFEFYQMGKEKDSKEPVCLYLIARKEGKIEFTIPFWPDRIGNMQKYEGEMVYHIEVDNTLESRMERMKEELRSKAADILFAGG